MKRDIYLKATLFLLFGLIMVSAICTSAHAGVCRYDNGYYADNIDGPYYDHGNGTVSDIGTGLLWQQPEEAPEFSWHQAVGYCENLTLAGYTDWRLPDLCQLQSLLDRSYTPKINTTYFPNAQTRPYWTWDVVRYNPDYAWYADFSNAYVGGGYQVYANCVKCVRYDDTNPPNTNEPVIPNPPDPKPDEPVIPEPDDPSPDAPDPTPDGEPVPTQAVLKELTSSDEIANSPARIENETMELTLDFPRYAGPVDIYIALVNSEGILFFLNYYGDLSTDFLAYRMGSAAAVETVLSLADAALASELYYGQCGLYWVVTPTNGGDIIKSLEGGAYELGYYGISFSTNKLIEKVQEIDSDGGVIKVDDSSSSINESSIEIRPGSVSIKTILEIGTYTDQLPDNPSAESIGLPIFFGPEGSLFTRDVIGTVPYDETQLPETISEDDISVSCWDGQTWSPTWVTDIDKVNNKVSFSTSHFSVFQAGWLKKDNPEIEWFDIDNTQFNALSATEEELNRVLKDILFRVKVNDINGLDDIKNCYVELEIYSGKDLLATELIEEYKSAATGAAADIWGKPGKDAAKIMDPVYDDAKIKYGIVFLLFDEKITEDGITTDDDIENDGIYTFKLPKEQLIDILLTSDEDFITRFEAQVYVVDSKDQKGVSEKKSIDILFDGQYQFDIVVKEPANEHIIKEKENGAYIQFEINDFEAFSSPGCTLYIDDDENVYDDPLEVYTIDFSKAENISPSKFVCEFSEESSKIIVKCGEGENRGSTVSDPDSRAIKLDSGIYYWGVVVESNEGTDADKLFNELIEGLEQITGSDISDNELLYNREDTKKSLLSNYDTKSPVYKFIVGEAPETSIKSTDPSLDQLNAGDTVTVKFEGTDDGNIEGYWWWTSDDQDKKGIVEDWLLGEEVLVTVPENITEFKFYVQAEDNHDIRDETPAEITLYVSELFEPPETNIIPLTPDTDEVNAGATLTVKFEGTDDGGVEGYWWWTSFNTTKVWVEDTLGSGGEASVVAPENKSVFTFYVQAEDTHGVVDDTPAQKIFDITASHDTNQRFVDNGDGKVTDNETGLIWEQADNGARIPWLEAVQYCEDLILAGYVDWRLPTLQELSELVLCTNGATPPAGRSNGCAGINWDFESPTIDSVFECRNRGYWTGSTYTYGGDHSYAWEINFWVGVADWMSQTRHNAFVRCVR